MMRSPQTTGCCHDTVFTIICYVSGCLFWSNGLWLHVLGAPADVSVGEGPAHAVTNSDALLEET